MRKTIIFIIILSLLLMTSFCAIPEPQPMETYSYQENKSIPNSNFTNPEELNFEIPADAAVVYYDDTAKGLGGGEIYIADNYNSSAGPDVIPIQVKVFEINADGIPVGDGGKNFKFGNTTGDGTLHDIKSIALIPSPATTKGLGGGEIYIADNYNSGSDPDGSIVVFHSESFDAMPTYDGVIPVNQGQSQRTLSGIVGKRCSDGNRELINLVFIVDTRNSVIEVINDTTDETVAMWSSEQLVITFEGDSYPFNIPTQYQFSSPTGIAITEDFELYPPQGQLYLSDQGNHRILVIDLDKVPLAISSENPGFLFSHIGNDDGSPGNLNTQFNMPHALELDLEGNLYVVDTGNHRVQKFSPDGTFMAVFGELGTGPGQLMSPEGIAIYGNTIYVIDTGNNRVVAFDKD